MTRVAAIVVGAVRAYARTCQCLLGLAIQRARCPGAIAPTTRRARPGASRPLLFSRLLRPRYAFATERAAGACSGRANARGSIGREGEGDLLGSRSAAPTHKQERALARSPQPHGLLAPRSIEMPTTTDAGAGCLLSLVARPLSKRCWRSTRRAERSGSASEAALLRSRASDHADLVPGVIALDGEQSRDTGRPGDPFRQRRASARVIASPRGR